ncbi:MAG: protein kinase domain-containing protein [Acidobacteriota bacterium]
MPLSPGARLGPYEIAAPLGASGKGEVYKATDTRLSRSVAIKVLPASLAEDAAMKARFDREARAVAALSHPNICTLHDIGREEVRGSSGEAPEGSAAVDFLVMEFLEGRTLARRLETGALPLDEALAITIAVADALDNAHRAGIVHRDLKPSNVMLTPGGPKLLDFGLATLGAPSRPGSSGSGRARAAGETQADLARRGLDSDRAKADLSRRSSSPGDRAKADITGQAVIVGTLQYMAPEQVNGSEPDARSDIFALGAMLYEMVTGQKAFEGKNRALLIAAIATLELDPLSKSRRGVSPALDHAAKRCLEKDPDDRWQTAHDLALQLRWIVERGASGARPATARGVDRRAAWAVAAALVLAAAASVPAMRYWQASVDAEAFQMRVPVAGLSDADIAISPDGENIALVARPNTQEPSALHIRPVGDVVFRKLAGTDDAVLPFWSPDSRSVAFHAGGRLKRVDASGGAPKDIGEAPGFAGGTWNREGTILFGSAQGVFRVSAEGGKPEAITTVEKPESGHYWPSFLPDGRRYTYLAWSADASRAVFVGTLGSSEKAKLMTADSNAVYAHSTGSGRAPGYLVFHREATLFAQPFDPSTAALTGQPVQIAGQLAFSGATGRGHFDVSQNGVLLYVQTGGATAGASNRSQSANPNVVFGWRDRAGKNLGPAGEQGAYGDMDLSLDGKFIAITRQDAAGSDIWVIDWERAGVPTRLTLDPSDDINPVWSPAGDRVAFTTYRKGNADIYVKNANSVGPETAILESASDELVEDWSKDGKYLAYKLGVDAFEDLYVLPLTGDDTKPIPIVTGPFRKDEPQFSYDGKWIAYASNESGGTFEVYVISFPALDQKLRVSAIGGGGQPRWRRDGRELYYKAPNGEVMAVELKPGPRLEAGIPRGLFASLGAQSSVDPARHQMSVTPDGQRFLVRYPNNLAGGPLAGGMTVVGYSAQDLTARGGVPATLGPNPQSVVSSGLTVVRNWPRVSDAQARE